MAKARKSKAPIRKPLGNKPIIRAGTRIGFADAEDDTEFLNDCYIDVGYVYQALSTEDPGSILLGRTGSGKTAAILRIESIEENVIRLNPEDLSLQYISNSDILSFFHELGVDLDVFFQLLWRHVFCVELINYKYKNKQSSKLNRPIDFVRDLVGNNPSKRLALDYLGTWETTFWEQSQERIREIVETFEGKLTSGVDLSGLGVPLTAQGSSKVTGEQRSELVRQSRKVVSEIQIRELGTLMDVMAEDIFRDKQGKYYILIDRLDENWVDDTLRYRLVRALIETIKSFRKIRNVKLIIALRHDLLERVYKYTKSSGFQEEKYEDFNIRLSWRKVKLQELVDRRIGELYRRQYTREKVTFKDIFPEKYRQERGCFDYLIARTQYRPRDIIAFVNEIFVQVRGKSDISANDIDNAEIEYSKKRLQALCTEWKDEHPTLDVVVEMLRNVQSRFTVEDIAMAKLEDIAVELIGGKASSDHLSETARKYMNGETTIDELRDQILLVLHKIGIVGVKPNVNTGTCFSFNNSYVFKKDDLGKETKLFISPMVWHALGCRKIRGKGDVMEELLQ